MREVISEKDARQGRLGQRVLLILLASLILAGVGWFLVEIYGTAISEDPPAGQIVDQEQQSQ